MWLSPTRLLVPGPCAPVRVDGDAGAGAVSAQLGVTVAPPSAGGEAQWAWAAGGVRPWGTLGDPCLLCFRVRPAAHRLQAGCQARHGRRSLGTRRGHRAPGGWGPCRDELSGDCLPLSSQGGHAGPHRRLRAWWGPSRTWGPPAGSHLLSRRRGSGAWGADGGPPRPPAQ